MRRRDTLRNEIYSIKCVQYITIQVVAPTCVWTYVIDPEGLYISSSKLRGIPPKEEIVILLVIREVIFNNNI